LSYYSRVLCSTPRCVPPKRQNEPKRIEGRSGLVVFTSLSWNHPADIIVGGNIGKIALARGILSR